MAQRTGVSPTRAWKNAARMSEIERRIGAGCFVIGLPPRPRPFPTRAPRLYSPAFAALLPVESLLLRGCYARSRPCPERAFLEMDAAADLNGGAETRDLPGKATGRDSSNDV